MMKAPYRNVIKTKILIRETVISLLSKNKTMNDITVSDVVEAANIIVVLSIITTLVQLKF